MSCRSCQRRFLIYVLENRRPALAATSAASLDACPRGSRTWLTQLRGDAVTPLGRMMQAVRRNHR